ncbi:alpha/beta hydrolase fold domain-containing protein [Leucobacter weissii]|uniref:Alpha/beta hydrolase fold domain-containing protein n=1 Tax=Leucobacter weissii TaxID=1983706 RepID=A0A939SBA5_9MICO|nr:alpha/beta hydrolase fold domain-containing protein [Leucobacter weissii]MBO1901198.1 alpha/beta hydrolase fold domain-containing protein [Leucobacter weissii]
MTPGHRDRAADVFDPELRAALAVVGGVFPPTITPGLIPFMRRSYASPPRDELLRGHDVEIEDFDYPGYGGAAIAGSIIRPAGARPSAVILSFHSGGMMFGDRFSGVDLALDWVARLRVGLVTVDYRLAPEHPHPTPFEDCYASLVWLAAHARELGFDPERVLIAGASAGGGLAAAVALAARERGGPRAVGQLLDYPMLDDRGVTDSTRRFDGVGVWDRVSNETGWNALLGDAVGGGTVSPYAAPARAETLAGLPPAYLDVGAAEIFRDETVDYAQRIWRDGGDAELHVWPGAFHACDIFARHTGIARAMIETRLRWLRRRLED